MAVKIKLMRLGKMRAPYYRIVVADARTKRDGRSIEMIGKYHPKEDPSFIEVDSDRALYWLGVGAQPTSAVAAILKVSGDWQKFKGLPAPPPMKVAEPKADKKAAFEAAAREGIDGSAGGGAATTAKKKAAPKTVANDDTAPAGHAAPPAGASATPAPADGQAPQVAETTVPADGTPAPTGTSAVTADDTPAPSDTPAATDTAASPDTDTDTAPAADDTAASPEGDAAPDVDAAPAADAAAPAPAAGDKA